MVISHKHKYIFIETPQTGCTAIREELIKNYGGISILTKHALYSTFLKKATKEEKEYFVFSTIRNPLDKYVSTFLKIKTDHNQRYTKRLRFKGWNLFYEIRGYLKYLNVKKHNWLFSDFINNNKFIPYDDISTLDHRKFDYVMRFENLNNDFQNTLRLIGLNCKRDLPVTNKTGDKKYYLEYYNTSEIRQIAKNKFKVFMEYWNYSFPNEWEVVNINICNRIIWRFFHILRVISWRYIRSKIPDEKKVPR